MKKGEDVRKKLARKGVVAVEFAIVFPIFFLIFYAIVTYGLIFAAQQTLTLAAAEGARAAVRYPAQLSPGSTQLIARKSAACSMANSAVDWLRKMGAGLGGTTCADSVPGDAAGIYVYAGDCTGMAASKVFSCVNVRINYSYASSPLIPRLLGPLLSLPTPDVLRGSAVAQVSLVD